MGPFDRLGRFAALIAAAILLSACFIPRGPETSTIVIVNKTMVPASVEDRGSRRIVAACAERTIEYHGTWGGDPKSDQPVAEPLPSGAYSVSLEDQFLRPFELPIHQTMIVDSKYGAHDLDSMPELRSAPCTGSPPPEPSPMLRSPTPVPSDPGPS